jgi:hypothetical protein
MVIVPELSTDHVMAAVDDILRNNAIAEAFLSAP